MDSTNHAQIFEELNKLVDMPPWGRPQGNQWDRLSHFIYRETTLAGVSQQAQAAARTGRLNPNAFTAYAVRRWYNHHTHNQILQMFYAHPDSRPEENRKHHSVDFYLRGIPFDLKISRFPKAYPKSLEFARRHPHHLAGWQYQNQSKEGRYHTGNRLFVVLHHTAQPEASWRLRREFAELRVLVDRFLQIPMLFGVTVANQRTGETFYPWSAVIFYVKSAEGA
jgi:hypothetical protein